MPDTSSQGTRIAGLETLANHACPASGYVVGGQPTAAQLTAAAAGLKRVINLRAPTEDAGYDEAAKSAELGLRYHNVPVAGPPGLTADAVRRLDRLLADQAAGPTLIHCATGNRVGALMALRAGWLQRKSAASCLALGRRWGLQPKLEPTLTDLLASGPAH